MSHHTRAVNPAHTFLPTEVEGFDALAELALDLRWSWNHHADKLWRRLDPALWDLTQNPWVVLQTVARDRLERLLADPDVRKEVRDLVKAKRHAAQTPAWFQQAHAKSPLTCVAYFSMEFMLSEALPIYSGGLGNVAGDQLKAASDLGVPVVGIGLLYQQGYFRQLIDRNGAQRALFPYNDPGQLPITPLREAERRMAAAGDHAARLLALAAHLAGGGRPREALPARLERRGEFPGPPRNHQRALRRRTGNAAAAGDGARTGRLAAAGGARHPAGSLPPERRARGVRRARTRPPFHGRDRPAVRSRRSPSRGRATSSPRTRRSPQASTVFLSRSSSSTSPGTPRSGSAYRSAISSRSAAGTRTTRRRISTWRTWRSAAAARSTA